MCYRRRCDICNKLTYGGCGKHVEQVLEGVPQQERCQGHTPLEKDDEQN